MKNQGDVEEMALLSAEGSGYQAPLSMEFSRQEDWSGFPCPALGMEAVSPVYPALAGGFFIIEQIGRAHV